MTRRIRAAALLAGVLVASQVRAQSPDLSGTWKLDRDASRIDAGAPYPGLGGSAGLPGGLYVTHARNGTVIVGSDVNTSHARTYRPGAVDTAPLPTGRISMRTGWQDESLVAEGGRDDGSTRLVESLRLIDGGAGLAVEIELTTSAGTRASSLVYRRAASEAPCKEWSTPCKDW